MSLPILLACCQLTVATIPAIHATKQNTLKQWNAYFKDMASAAIATSYYAPPDAGGTCLTTFNGWFTSSRYTGPLQNRSVASLDLAAITQLKKSADDCFTESCRCEDDYRYPCCPECAVSSHLMYPYKCTVAKYTENAVCNMPYNEDGNLPLPAGFRCDRTAIHAPRMTDDITDPNMPERIELSCAVLDAAFNDGNPNSAPGLNVSSVLDASKASDSCCYGPRQDLARAWAPIQIETRAAVAGGAVAIDAAREACFVFLEPVIHGVIFTYNATAQDFAVQAGAASPNDIRIYNPTLGATTGINMTSAVDQWRSRGSVLPVRSTFAAGKVTIVGGSSAGEIEFHAGVTEAKLQGLTNSGTVSVIGAPDVFICDTLNSGTFVASGSSVVVANVTNTASGTVTITDGSYEVHDLTSAGSVVVDSGTTVLNATGIVNTGTIAINAGTVDITLADNTGGTIAVSDGVTGSITLSSGGSSGTCNFPSTVTVTGFSGCGGPAPRSGMSTITASFTGSGQVSEYDDETKLKIKQIFASAAGVSTSDVMVTVTAGSVVITVTITVAPALAQRTSDTLSAGILASPTSLQSALDAASISTGITVSSVTATSVSTPSGSDGDDGNPCFPSSALVTKADGTPTRVDRLKEGDAIIAATSDGTLTTDTVTLLSIAKPEARGATFLVLTTSDGYNLTLTPTHHLPTGASCCSTLKTADEVHEGETVWRVRAGTSIVPQTIIKVTKKAATGLHSPVLAAGGFPIVDSFVTSFDSIAKVTLAKYGLVSLLVACRLMGVCESLRTLFA